MASWLGFGSKGDKPKKPSQKKKKKGGGFMSNVLRHKTFGKAKETPDDEFMLVRFSFVVFRDFFFNELKFLDFMCVCG